MSYYSLGNDIMGEGIAIYPYILLNVMRAKHFQVSVKLAAGLTAVNGHYKATVNEVIPNKTFGSCINAYLSGGLNVDFPIYHIRGVSILPVRQAVRMQTLPMNATFSSPHSI